MLVRTENVTMPVNIGFELISSKVIDLTPEVVADFRKIEASEVEREISQTHVKHLRDKIIAGLGVSFHWVTAELDGKTLRGNGQHSSVMLSQLPEEHFPRKLKVLREHYKCDSPDAFASLFQQFDDRKSKRTSDDVAAVYQGFQPDLKNVPHNIAKLAIDGYVWYQRTIEGAHNIYVGDLVYTLMSNKNLHPFIQWMAEVHNSKTRELQNKPTAGAMFGTFAASEQAAREFWESVAAGGDPDSDDSPARVLDLWLRSIYEGTFEKPDQWKPTWHYQGNIYAWNAYREDKRINSIKFEVKKNVSPIRE